MRQAPERHFWRAPGPHEDNGCRDRADAEDGVEQVDHRRGAVAERSGEQPVEANREQAEADPNGKRADQGKGPWQPGCEEQGAEPDHEQCGGWPEAHSGFDPRRQAHGHPDERAGSVRRQHEPGCRGIERIALGNDRQGRAVECDCRTDADEGQQAGCDRRRAECGSGTATHCLALGLHSAALIREKLVEMLISVVVWREFWTRYRRGSLRRASQMPSPR